MKHLVTPNKHSEEINYRYRYRYRNRNRRVIHSRKNYHPQFRDTKLDELSKIIVKEYKTTEFLTILKIYRNKNVFQ